MSLMETWIHYRFTANSVAANQTPARESNLNKDPTFKSLVLRDLFVVLIRHQSALASPNTISALMDIPALNINWYRQ